MLLHFQQESTNFCNFEIIVVLSPRLPSIDLTTSSRGQHRYLNMGNSEKRDTGRVNVSEGPVTLEESNHGSSSVAVQTRTRRLFSLPQLFSFSLVYMATWYCVAS